MSALLQGKKDSGMNEIVELVEFVYERQFVLLEQSSGISANRKSFSSVLERDQPAKDKAIIDTTVRLSFVERNIILS